MQEHVRTQSIVVELVIHIHLLAVVFLSVRQCMQLTDDAGMAGADTERS